MTVAATATSSALGGWDIIKLVISTGVVTTIINQGVSWFRDSRKDTKANAKIANYSALCLAVELEAFSIACADAISASHMASNSEGYAGRQHTKVPDLQSFPKDIDWKILDPSISAKILTFRNELTLAHQAIVFWYDVASECVPNECLKQLGLCGYRAWMMAAELRERYNIPCFDPKILSWDVETLLKKEYDQAVLKSDE